MGQEVDKSKILYSIFHNDSQITFDITDDVLSMGNFLGNHYQILREIYKTYRKLDLAYEYKPKIGAPVTVSFKYDDDDRSVTFERQGLSLTFTEPDFLIFMAKIDAVYGEIYPIGTVVELDEEMLPLVIQDQLKTSGVAELVVLAGRKITLQEPFDKYLVDYYAYLWPLGQLGSTPPIFISNMMIKRVVHMGFQHPLEDTFAMDVLRATQLASEQISTAYMPVDDGIAFYEKYTDFSLSEFLSEEEES